MIRWLIQVIKQQTGYNQIDLRDRLELELHALHNRSRMETNQKVAENHAHIRAWEARGGRQAWEAWVTRERDRINATERAASLG